MRQRDPVGSVETENGSNETESDLAPQSIRVVPAAVVEPVTARVEELFLAPPPRITTRGEALPMPTLVLPLDETFVTDSIPAELLPAALSTVLTEMALVETPTTQSPWETNLGATTLALVGLLSWFGDAHWRKTSQDGDGKCTRTRCVCGREQA
jgi:hypothetical protein